MWKISHFSFTGTWNMYIFRSYPLFVHSNRMILIFEINNEEKDFSNSIFVKGRMQYVIALETKLKFIEK